MGFDIRGKNPTNKAGESFRNNIWWWRPLWEYCHNVAPDIITKEIYNAGRYNDGREVDSEETLRLADRLQTLIDEGSTEAYRVNRETEIAALPDEMCMICGGGGKRAEPPWTGPGPVTCNDCRGTGKRRPWVKNYLFDVENVQEFATFLQSCGGFEIW